MKPIKYVTDEFLDEYKTNFDNKYLDMYKYGDMKGITEIFSDENKVIDSVLTFDYEPLLLESEHGNVSLENIKKLWESLKHLSIVEAGNEKLWVALENTYYLEYHLDQLKIYNNNNDNSIKSRTIFTQGKKRSLSINNLALLWWVAYYTYDETNIDDPYYYTKFFVESPYRGNALAFFSSNIVSNKEITLGVLSAIKELVDNKKMKLNRYSYTNSNKILNQIGGVRIIDTLERNEIKSIILENILDSANIRT